MKTFAITVFTMLMSVSGLAALGYTSALVEADKQYEQYQLSRLEQEEEFGEGWKSETGYYPQAPSHTIPGAYYAYPQAQNLQLAMRSLDPLGETTTKLIYGLIDTILRRFKQQLFISTISQWRDEMLVSDYRHLFPHLSSLLSSIDSDSFLSTYDLWKAAIDSDLEQAPLGVLSYTVAIRGEDGSVSAAEFSLLREMRDLMDDAYTYHTVSNLDEYILVSTSDKPEHSQFFRLIGLIAKNMLDEERSEERRVGKECRSRWSPYH